ncbi:trihelix transcription factor GTL1-like isoform X2 [Dioscorea cayenensis subsp. rotundata]|uniref:Trihelix transcription factor GTL1-like isoform X2 n=1 Tax=Dioscorea cayennensis subsp. rotundata TaxID=55577 RepID=A0AB40AGG4_DIOCR|nr:trihelix transcription factor GTL1-like isoform X2 [Dioscorea cayenensis subsp. rotundata]
MQQGGGGGGSQYGAPPPPEMPPFGISTTDQPEAASPISSRPPPNFDELAPAVPGPPFQDDDSLAAAAAVDDTDRGGLPGNRWPRQETLALLKIRSEMDSVFRDATLKGPLWEEVSRKLAELGYMRSAKKCKEKFENVHKYYKRTKEGRAGRQDGKSYRFFSQLEALHSSSGAASSAANPNPSPPPSIGVLPGLSGTSSRLHTTPISASPITTAAPASGVAGIAGISLSSNTSSEDSDDEDTEEMVTGEGRKRKHPHIGQGDSSGGSSSTSRKMMAFFEGLMKQVMERQEAMQQKFLETIEKREQDRMIREEAWKRQEMARLNREHELMAQERAMAASRDAAVISFLQKITGQTISIPTPTTTTTIPAASAPQMIVTPVSVSVSTPTPQPTTTKPAQQPLVQNSMEIVRHQVSVSSELGIVPVQQESHEAMGSSSSSRWPKAEVHALIQLRSGLEYRYQEAGPKGPLWEEISSEMTKLGFNRSSKRCKEKWENINKYFKKVKESNKKRPEDAKTCPYFHQLDALYRRKLAAGGGGGSSSVVSSQALQTETTSSNPVRQDNTMQSPQQVPPAMVVPETEGKSDGGGGGGAQIPTSNGGTSTTFFEETSSGSVMKKKTL